DRDAAFASFGGGERRDLGYQRVDVHAHARGLATCDETAQRENRIGGALRLRDDLLEYAEQTFAVDLARAQPPNGTLRVVDDRRQRLTDFVGDAGRHFADDVHPGGVRELFAPQLCLFLHAPLLGDVAPGRDEMRDATGRVPQRHDGLLLPIERAVLAPVDELFAEDLAAQDGLPKSRLEPPV